MSLGLGWAGEPYLEEMFQSLFHPLMTPAREAILHGVSFGLAFLTMSYFHVVIGEVVPKNLAIDKADRLALIVAPVLLVFERISAPFVLVVEKSSSLISRLLGVRGHGGGGHSTEELKFILESSRREGHLEGFEQSAIQKLLELKEISTREVMTPRMDMVAVSADASLDELLRITLEHKYSRLPVYEKEPDQIIGTVHYKDLMNAWQERKMAGDRGRPVLPFRLRRYLREPLIVPETKPLHQLVDEFRKSHSHLAVVVDEFGTVTGLVTLEDVLEQVFGEIGDEHDIKRPAPVPGAPVVHVEGNISIRDLASQYSIDLPGDAGFETLAGFLLFQLGYIPAPGDTVTHGKHHFTVQVMERNRIARVKVVTAREAGRIDPASS
jgi:putative hemolysin